jgi:predicted amidohydrolase YtcJ
MTLVVLACATKPNDGADVLFIHGTVYTLNWPEPNTDGTPSTAAPYSASGGWHPDAQAVAVRGGEFVFVGSDSAAERWRGPNTRVVDLHGATVGPGLVDAHTHVANLGRSLSRVNLVGVKTEAEAVDKVVELAAKVPKGEWIVGYGWDEGAWANHYPDMRALSERVPDHPVFLQGLHTFASWGNRLAFERAHIDAKTPAPNGGEIRKDASGNPSGILLNNAQALVERIIPAPTPAQLDSQVMAGLDAVAKGGYVAVHEAGADSTLMASFERLARANTLPIRVYAMIAGRDTAYARTWVSRRADTTCATMLCVRSVKAFYDGALGSRGARLLADYSDRPGQRGIAGREYGFDESLMSALMHSGFQVVVHAIGDAANRATLDFFEHEYAANPQAKSLRNRVEHAQVVHPDDIPRFGKLDVIASMQPSHAVEDMPWAEQRVGPERIKGAYAWRTLRRAGARLIFSSDLPGTDYDFFYGLHSAITRRDKSRQPNGGWYPEQRMTPEEAVRGYTTWAAYAGFDERKGGQITPGRRADLTVLDLDPFTAAPDRLLDGHAIMTVAGGRIVAEKR